MPRRVNRQWLTVATIGLGTFAITAGVVWLTVNIARGELGTSDQLASVTSAYVGICALVVTVIGTIVTARQNRDGTAIGTRFSPHHHTRRPAAAPDSRSDGPGAHTDNDLPAANATLSIQEMISFDSGGKWGSAMAEPWRHKIVPVPRQLPAHSPHFIGRTAELRQLTALLDNLTMRAGTVIAAIRGTAGIGKTALALHWAHKTADQFPDGQLYVNLRGFDPTGNPMPPTEAIRIFLDAFEIPPERIPASLDAQVALYRSLLARRRLLVVLDNARDSDQVRPLLSGSPSCLVIVTSRNQLTGLVATEGAQPLTLDLLTRTEARELLVRYSGNEKVGNSREADELIDLCTRLPLALVIVSVWTSTHPGFPLAALINELQDASTRLNTLDGGDTGVDISSVFSWSYRYLSTQAGRAFRLLGAHPGPDISLSAVASLVGIPVRQAGEVLRELTRASLLTQTMPNRFAFHDLLRTYASDLAHVEDCDAERHAAVRRMLDYYLHTAHAATLLLHPTRDPLTLAPPQPGVVVENLATDREASAWLETEHPVLLAVIAQAANDQCETYSWQLTWSLATFFDRRGYWHDWAATQRIALAAAERLSDRNGQARAHRGLGQACLRLGFSEEAHTHLQHALDLFQQLNDQVGQAQTHVVIAWTFGQQGHDDKALKQTQQALRLYQDSGHLDGKARALNGLGWYHAQLGELHQSLTYCEQAFTLFRDLGDRLGEAATWDSLGYVHHLLGHHSQALTCYQQALKLWQELDNRYYQATTLTNLGDTHHASGDSISARNAWQQALTILDVLQHIDAEQVRVKLHHLLPGPTGTVAGTGEESGGGCVPDAAKVSGDRDRDRRRQ